MRPEEPEKLAAKFRGALVGDALGAPFEGAESLLERGGMDGAHMASVFAQTLAPLPGPGPIPIHPF
ncbi:MAG: hypothetical protein WEB06_10030 [Actinomycetota bacterium]